MWSEIAVLRRWCIYSLPYLLWHNRRAEEQNVFGIMKQFFFSFFFLLHQISAAILRQQIWMKTSNVATGNSKNVRRSNELCIADGGTGYTYVEFLIMYEAARTHTHVQSFTFLNCWRSKHKSRRAINDAKRESTKYIVEHGACIAAVSFSRARSFSV